MRIKSLILSLFFFLFANQRVFAVTPSISSVSQPQGSFQKFTKIEWDLTVNKEYPNPYYFYDSSDTPQNNPTNTTWYGVDGVSVDMVVQEPGASSEIKVPAFYYQDYKRILIDGLQILGKVGKPVWKVRFTPSKVGVYSYYFTIQDKEGMGRYPQSGTLSFTVSESNNDGFIRVSAKDPRFLAFDSGKPYIPIGAGSQWYPNRLSKSYSYEDLFNKFGENGVNLIRIWDESDFALGIDGAQTVWSTATDPLLAARGVEIKTNNVRSGLRSARPANGDPWYQRLAISEPNNNHRLVAWVKYSNLTGNGARIFVKKGASYNSGQILAQSQTFLGTQSGWQQVTLDFIPESEAISLVLENNSNQGNFYVDDVSLGPLNNNSLKYDVITDGGFERHFAKGNPGNNPDADRNLPREFGNYVNQHTAYELDKIIQSAEKNNVKIQLCSCSGPWFTWPQDPDMYNWSDVWVLKSWQRNFRYRVARWGYSPSILAWEKHNEHGHITPGSALFDFYKKYGQYQKTVDIYKHLRTTSQNSQAYSPQFWSTNEVDIANYHDYLDFRSATYTNLSNDEALFFQRFAWCLTDTRGPSSPYCNGLGLGDGTTWYGNPKPWIWGETGVYQNGKAIQGGTAGALFLHNTVWAGLFSPMGTTPLDWYQSEEDSTSTNAKFSSRKAASIFFSNINFDGGKMVFFATVDDLPPGYPTDGDKITSSNSNIRAYAMRRQDGKAIYAWIQNRNSIWSKAQNTVQPASGTLTFSGLVNGNYKVQYFDTRNGAYTLSNNVNVDNSTVNLTISNLSSDIAVKIENQNLLSNITPIPQPTVDLSVTPKTNISPTPVLGNGDVNQDGKVDLSDILTLFTNWLNISIKENYDQYKDDIVNTFDYAVVAKKLSFPKPILSPTNTPPPITTATPTPQPTATPTIVQPQPILPPTSTSEWTQFAFNPQRTSYTPKEVPTPWRWKWAWNGPADNGGIVADKFGLPRNVQPVTGGGQVYVAAGANGVYALNSSNGSVVWNQRPSGASINSTVAYDPKNGVVFAVGTNGVLYKLNATNGNIVGMYNSNASSSFALPPLIVDQLVIFSMGNKVHALTITTLQPQWVYEAGIAVDTPPAYSQKRNLIIVGARDLYFHGINATNGTRVWRNKPTIRTGYPASGTFGSTPMTKSQAEVAYGWPVVSDANDIVLVTYRLDWNTLWTWSPWPTTNEQMRQNLANNPGEQAVFALNLQTGNEAFKINLTSGGFGDGDYLPMGNIPIVKRESNGNEVAYAIIRGDNRPGVDGRGDSKFGEVILNNNTISGYQPGYVRFIAYNNYGWPDGAGLSNMPSDEMPFLSMAGNYLFAGHWMAGKGLIIENRDFTKGSFNNPITSKPIPHIVSSTNSNTPQNCGFSKTHYCSVSVLYQEGDTRSFAGPGFYIYYGHYSPAVYDRYWVDYAGWVISDNMVLFRSTDGAIIALENGNPLTQNFLASTDGQVAGAETVKQSNEKTPGPNIIPVDSASAFIGQYKTVEGTVVDVFDNKKAIYITFSKPHTGKLLVRIKGRPYQSLKNHIFEKIKPNEVIRVTGRIDMYRGDPVIYVENLNQIKKPPLEKNNLIQNFFLKLSTKIFNKN